MVLILPEHSQRPYRYGMTLLCIGAMFNWLGLADNNAEPVRYIGVTLIAAGAMLICLAMCFWMKATHDPQVAALQAEQDTMHHIVTIHRGDAVLEKPPDYDTVTGALPPSYEDAIKLSPAHLQVIADRDSADGVTVLKPEGESQPQSPGSQSGTSSSPTESTSALCHVHQSGSSKPDVSSSDESSPVDNFGTRVLRISRKFLRRSRSVQDVEGDLTSSPGAEHTVRNTNVTNSSVNLNVTPDVSVR